jgi:hypothetical protein
LPTDAGGRVETVSAEVHPGPFAEAKNTFDSLKVSEQWDTSAQVVIKTTEAEMRNILYRHLDALRAREAWIPPLTVVIAIAVALISGVRSHSGRYVLVFGLGMAALWFGWTAKRAYECRKHTGIDAVIADLETKPEPPQRR